MNTMRPFFLSGEDLATDVKGGADAGELVDLNVSFLAASDDPDVFFHQYAE